MVAACTLVPVVCSSQGEAKLFSMYTSAQRICICCWACSFVKELKKKQRFRIWLSAPNKFRNLSSTDCLRFELCFKRLHSFPNIKRWFRPQRALQRWKKSTLYFTHLHKKAHLWEISPLWHHKILAAWPRLQTTRWPPCRHLVSHACP